MICYDWTGRQAGVGYHAVDCDCQVPLHTTRLYMSVLLVLDKSLSFQLANDKVTSL